MANDGNDHAELHPGAGTGAATRSVTGSATGSSSELSPPSTAGLAGSTQAGEPSPRSVLDNVDEKSESTRPDKVTSRDAADAAKNKEEHTDSRDSHDSHDDLDDSDDSSDGDPEDAGRRNDTSDVHQEHPDDDGTLPMANEPGAGLQALEVQMSQQANERPASLSLARTVSRAPTIIPRSKRRGLFGQFAILPEVERPYEYRNKTKWLITLIVALTAAGGPLGSSILYPALASLTVDLHTSPTTANLNVALYMLAMGIFPLWWSSFSETLGRRTIYIISFCLFVVFSILSAISKSIGMLIVMRVLAGGASASVQAVGAGTLADIWEPRERGRAMGIFYLGPLTGPLFAPIIGGALAEKWGWESTMWFLTIYGGLAFVMLFFCLPETLARDRRPPRELEKKERTDKPPQTQAETQADVEGQATNMADGEAAESGAVVAPALARMTTTQSVRVQTQRVGSFLKVAFVQPLSVLLYLRFPPILLTVVYGSVTFGSLFVLNVSIQSAFAKPPYQFSELIVGLLYIPSSLGYILASLVGGRWIDNIMAREARKAGRYDQQGRLVFLPEDRMRENAWLSASLFPAALVWFGWTAQHGIYWIVPSIANFVFGFGSMLVFGAVTTMLTEFMPRRSSGGIALNNFLRNIFSCVGAIVAQPLIGAMGYGWLCTMFALLAWIVGNTCIFLLRRNGSKWRKNMDEQLNKLP
ncbi:MFS multidrug resistance transporter [Sporothrix schenckii 1099-18]|uniref:MFS multidrug resistance transporter n=1 Tax=Sporothrix schenckii 1099-18 TaxID=1397361 RepID=A0A0F2MID4_SPOSC|nr:MFS multidrug resistance transporter [Sporothrix schenckii 1099-18]KJR88829.1 MFS multidrug resistance transporter [Sporothrix schenckii 1099-18]